MSTALHLWFLLLQFQLLNACEISQVIAVNAPGIFDTIYSFSDSRVVEVNIPLQFTYSFPDVRVRERLSLPSYVLEFTCGADAFSLTIVDISITTPPTTEEPSTTVTTATTATTVTTPAATTATTPAATTVTTPAATTVTTAAMGTSSSDRATSTVKYSSTLRTVTKTTTAAITPKPTGGPNYSLVIPLAVSAAIILCVALAVAVAYVLRHSSALTYKIKPQSNGKVGIEKSEEGTAAPNNQKDVERTINEEISDVRREDTFHAQNTKSSKVKI